MDNFCVICKDFNPKLRYFHVPTNIKRKRRWRNMLNGLELRPLSKMCEKHFLPQHIIKSVKFNCFQLTKDATPKLELNTYSNKKTFQRSVGIQTELKDAGICAFVTVADNFWVYNVNCFYCDASFSIRNWDKFMFHIQKNHRRECGAFYDCGVEVECAVEKNVEPNMPVFEHVAEDCQDIDQMEIEAAENNDENEDFLNEMNEEPLPKETVEMTEPFNYDWDEDNALSSDEETDDENDHFKTIGNRRTENHQTATDKNELNVESSDPVIICGLLDLFELHPVLWFFKVRARSKYAIKELLSEFNEKFALNFTMDELCDSLRDISTWYRGICEKQDADKLSYPQSEYFQKCSKFLPDKLDGITCGHCQRIMPDHLLYFIHKKYEHPNCMSASDETDEKNCKFQGIARTEINNYLEIRYAHDRSDANEVSFQCPACYKDCKKKHLYLGHIKWHLNVRDHVCDLCGAAFVRKMGLVSHKKRHFGLLQSVCQICSKVCNDAQLLRTHRQTYHRPIEGTIEEIEASLRKRFDRKKGFTKYKTRIDPKTNQRRYVCDYCDKDYTLLPSLFKHTNHHKDKYRATVDSRLNRKITHCKTTKKIIKVEKFNIENQGRSQGARKGGNKYKLLSNYNMLPKNNM